MSSPLDDAARYEAVVVGASAGGLTAIKTLISALPAGFGPPIVIAQHIADDGKSMLASYLDRFSLLPVKEAEDKEPVAAGHIYLAPAGYHLLIEEDRSFGLSVDPRVNYSCPSIDVLFESAAEAYGDALIGVILTGANRDGARGLQTVGACGGLTLVQNPRTAESPVMPQAAFDRAKPDHIVEIEQLAPLLVKLCRADHGGKNESVARYS